MKNYIKIFAILFSILPSFLFGQLKEQKVSGNNEPALSHISGRANPNVEFTVVDPSQLTGNDYYIKFFDDDGRFKYQIDNIQTKNIVDQTAILYGTYFDGMFIKFSNKPFGLKWDSKNSTSNRDYWGWEEVSGTRRFTWANANPSGVFNLETFGAVEGSQNSIGWTSPRKIFNPDQVMMVGPTELKKIEIRLAYVDFDGDYNPPININDENVSYGYRYLRRADQPAARPEFAPYIHNTESSVYPFQSFAKNVPLSVWDVTDISNPRRLAVGFLENNVEGGLVDGKYWPGSSSNIIDNVNANSPREWLFIFDEDYSETPNSVYWDPIAYSDARVMYTAVWNRRPNAKFSINYSGEDRIAFIPNIPLSEKDSYLIIPRQGSIDLSLSAGWNLLSLPYFTNMNLATNIFPNKISPVFSFLGGYTNNLNLWPTRGFFVKYPASETIPFRGDFTGEIVTYLMNGWNLIGISKWELDPASIETSVHRAIATPFYKFNSGYQVATSLEPGKGYWVKSNESCWLSLLPVPFFLKKNSSALEYNTDGFSSISLCDARNNSIALYLADEETGEQYELPPIPPSGVFDARFTSNKSAENISGSWKTILINSAEYPVTIQSGKNILIRDYSGVEIKLSAGEKFVINNPAIERLEIKDMQLPVEYSLMQNYPNPFNPSTTIKFGIPEKTNVSLEIYSLLGERVAQPINSVLEAGYHEINWDASHLSSGIYIYKLITNNFTSVKKMIFMK